MKKPPTWMLVVVLASTLSQDTLSFSFGPIASTTLSPPPVPLAGFARKPDGESNAASQSRIPDQISLRFPGPQSHRPLRNRQRLPSNSDAISFPMSDVADNKRFERSRRQLSFPDPHNSQRPYKPNRGENNNGGSGTLTFPSDHLTGNNKFPARPPNSQRPQRPQHHQRPQRPQRPPADNGFVFNWEPTQAPIRSTTQRQRVTPATTPRAERVTAEPPPVTRPTPASTRAGCNCRTTEEFNPVCGEDRVTYNNPGKLKCANYCGNRVEMVHLGRCITTTTPRPTLPSRVPTPTRGPPNIRKPQQWGWLH